MAEPRPGCSKEKDSDLFSSPIYLPKTAQAVKAAKAKAPESLSKGKGPAQVALPKASKSSASPLSDSAILPVKRRSTRTLEREDFGLPPREVKKKALTSPSATKRTSMVSLLSPKSSEVPASSDVAPAPLPLMNQEQMSQIAAMVAGLFQGGLASFAVSSSPSTGPARFSGVDSQSSSGTEQLPRVGMPSTSCALPLSETGLRSVSGAAARQEVDVVSQASPVASRQLGLNCGVMSLGYGSFTSHDTVRSPSGYGPRDEQPPGSSDAPPPLFAGDGARERSRSGLSGVVRMASRSGSAEQEERVAGSAFADGASGFPARARALPAPTDVTSVYELPYGYSKQSKSGTARETEVDRGLEDFLGRNAPSMSPPVLCRQDTPDAYGLALADADQPEVGSTSDFAILFRGLQITAQLEPTLVKHTSSTTRPSFGPLVREETLQFAPHPVVGNWMNHHWNLIRNHKSLGADPWTPEVWPLASWPRSSLALPASKPVFRTHALVEDPAVPPPALPNEAELMALRKPGTSAKGYTPSGSDRTMVLLETHLQAATDGLQASAALTSALSRALKDVDDPDRLSEAPDSAAILDLLDALPVALTCIAKGLTAARVSTTVARRDAFLLQQETDRAAAEKLRVLPMSSGSLFGPYLKQALESGPATAPVSADEFARALVSAMPVAPKPRPARSGWGGGRQPRQPKGAGKQQSQPPRGRNQAPRRGGRRGGHSGRKNPPPPPPKQGN